MNEDYTPRHSQRPPGGNRPRRFERPSGGNRWNNRNKGPIQQRSQFLPADMPIYRVPLLNKLKLSELQAIAKAEGVRHFWSTPRKQLILEILKQQLRRGAPVTGQGVLELTPESHGFLRSLAQNLQANDSDPFIPVQVIRQYNLYGGLEVEGSLRQPRSGDKHLVMNVIDRVERKPLTELKTRIPFERLTAVYPSKRIFLEVEEDPSKDMSRRIIDLISPIGMGQRGIIIAPPRVGKTVLMKKMVQSVELNHKDVVVIVLLIDERPEEVTDMRESIQGHVIASTFDEHPSRHIQVANTAINRAKVLVESGKDVVLFLDSITRLARAYNSNTDGHGRLMSGGVDSEALQKTKQFFGLARNIEEGGSLTILGTALVDTGSRMDQVIYEEFRGSGNMDLYLDRDLANHRIYPAVNIQLSSTRNDDLLLDKAEYEIVSKVRKHLKAMTPMDAISRLMQQLSKYKTNAEFLMSIRNNLN